MINWVAWWYTPGGPLSVEELTAALTEQAVASLRSRGPVGRGDTVEDILTTIRPDLTAVERLVRKR